MTFFPNPHTNGGSLFSGNNNTFSEIKLLFAENGLSKFIKPIGQLLKKEEKVIHIEN